MTLALRLFKWLLPEIVNLLDDVTNAVDDNTDSQSEMLRRIELQATEISDLRSAYKELASELNALRNAAPVVQEPKGVIRTMRHFSEFRAAAERKQPVPGTPQPIQLERNS